MGFPKWFSDLFKKSAQSKFEVTEPIFVEVEGVEFDKQGKYQTGTGKFSGLVVHYTVSGRTPATAKGVMGWLDSMHYGCMIMDADGKIYIPKGWNIFTDWDDHAGESKWGSKSSVSRYFAGMEICCWGKGSSIGPFRESKGEANIIAGKYQQYTEAQEKALINFILWARKKNPEFSLDNVVGHDEIRAEAGNKGGKSDPGASLSMTMPNFRKHLKSLEG